MIVTFSSIKDHLRAFDDRIISSFNDTDALVQKTIAPYVLNQGKRIRPALVYLSALSAGTQPATSCHNYALTTELIHTASLFHDDVIDNARLRRGRPAANRLHGNDTAVLIGDYLYMKALALVESETISVRRAVHRTVMAMTQAEIFQGLSRFRLLSENDYYRVIEGKTSGLISLCCRLGASLAGRKKWTLGFAEYGRRLGIAFQLIDDLMDWIGTPDSGKDLRCDIREGRITLPVIRLLDTMSDKEKSQCIQDLTGDRIQKEPDVIDRYIRMMETREIESVIRNEADRILTEGIRLLEDVPATIFKQDLQKFSTQLINRSA